MTKRKVDLYLNDEDEVVTNYQHSEVPKPMKGRNNTPNTFKAKTDAARDTAPLRPMNNKQAEYIEAIKNHAVVIATGVWGSSKTYIPSVMACDMLLAKKIDKIVVARPTEGKAKSVGFYKGDKNEKLEGWCAPISDVFKRRLGVGHYEAFVMNGKIELLSLEQVKGRSWDNTFILVDEVEDLEPAVAKSLVGRQGVNSITVLTGDIDQKDLKSYSGLELLLEVANYGNIDLALIDFDDWDYCVRSQEAKAWGMAFEKYERSRGRVK